VRVLLGETTYRLVRHAVEIEPVEPLELKGKAERVPAYRLLSVQRAETVERHLDRPLVGRAPELAVLVDELSSAVRDRSCRLVTLIAEAGTGKSRLIEESPDGKPGARVVKADVFRTVEASRSGRSWRSFAGRPPFATRILPRPPSPSSLPSPGR